MKQETEKTRYSDAELQEFKELILEKLRKAKEELNALASSLSSPNANGTDDTAGTYKTLEDGSATLEKESINQLAARQKKFIEQLEAALVRIENKTYGICRETGKLIQKERLRAVPHTTLSMEAKLKQYLCEGCLYQTLPAGPYCDHCRPTDQDLGTQPHVPGRRNTPARQPRHAALYRKQRNGLRYGVRRLVRQIVSYAIPHRRCFSDRLRAGFP